MPPSQVSKRALVLIPFAATVFLLAIASYHAPRPAFLSPGALKTGSSDNCTATPPLRSGLGLWSRIEPIQNIVHYVQLKKDENSTLRFSFREFLSLYAAVLYIKPNTIFIHTDHDAATIADAALSGNTWTRKILKGFSVVKIEHVSSQAVVNSISVHVEARSDFARQEVLHEHGGLSIDWDVVPLKDVHAFRRAGFQTIVGRQRGSNINNGVILTQKHSALTYLMSCEGPRVFNGGWETHSVHRITKIAEYLALIPSEVLILDEKAFAPTDWGEGSVKRLFETHDEPVNRLISPEKQDVLTSWYSMAQNHEWELDFRSTYLLHAFHRGDRDIPGFQGVNISYILARNSNYALAAYPIVKHAIDQGVLSEQDRKG